MTISLLCNDKWKEYISALSNTVSTKYFHYTTTTSWTVAKTFVKKKKNSDERNYFCYAFRIYERDAMSTFK